ncbi:MAG: hypothetical protein F4056_10295, partial [Chloroflexi bacterium]|nr:hypothetical protein [Chloroflexota bacterium]
MGGDGRRARDAAARLRAERPRGRPARRRRDTGRPRRRLRLRRRRPLAGPRGPRRRRLGRHRGGDGAPGLGLGRALRQRRGPPRGPRGAERARARLDRSTRPRRAGRAVAGPRRDRRALPRRQRAALRRPPAGARGLHLGREPRARTRTRLRAGDPPERDARLRARTRADARPAQRRGAARVARHERRGDRGARRGRGAAVSAQRNGQPGEALVPAPALLGGLRVLEYGESAASAFAARMLGDLGATVTKIEPPGGSPLRREGYTPEGGDASALFAYTSAGKRSVTLDDTTAEGRETLLRLIADCDVLVASHRGSHWQELGVDFEALPGSGRCALAVSITPFGRFGPHAEWAATHLTAHHAGGEAYFFHGGIGYDRYPDGPPLRVPASIAELDAGSAAVVGMLGWLAGWPDAEREPTHLDLSWQEAAMSLCRQDIVKWPNDRYLDTRALREVAVLGLVECKDGWAEVLPAQQHMWERLVEAAGNPPWATELGETADHRIAHTEELNQLFEPWLRERTRTEIFDALRDFDVPGGPVRLMGDLLTCQQMRLREFLQTVALADGTTAEIPAQPYIVREARGPAWRPGPASGVEAAATPSAGQHNEEALRDLPDAPAMSTAPSIRATADPQRPLGWLRGTRVLDLTWYQAGPYANMILCAFGAEILKIESHRRIDPFRHSRRHQSVSLADRKTDDWIDKGYR